MATKKLAISKFFHERLLSPLHDVRKSWGSYSQSIDTVFLRVWEDEVKHEDGRFWVMVQDHEPYDGKKGNFGYRERGEHLDLVRSGSKCWLVFCKVNDINAVPRKIIRYNETHLLEGGEITIDESGNEWMECLPRRLVDDAVAETIKTHSRDKSVAAV